MSPLPILLLLLVLVLGACGGEDPSADTTATEGTTGAATDAAADTAAADCSPESLETLEPGVLTFATGEPAYEPWVVGDAPESGEGFEAAVAYAIAEELGYAEEDVAWVRADFNASIQPGPKDFDLNLSQFSITEERKEAVDFSAPYYDVRQAVIAVGDSPAAEAASLEDLRDVRIGAQVGTTSFTAIEEVIQPETDPSVYNTNDEAKVALENGQIDALVVDLPTAFYITAAELDDGVIVGQLADEAGEGEVEQFGAVLELDSPLTDCVSQAVDSLRADGTLDQLEQEWLADVTDAPVLE